MGKQKGVGALVGRALEKSHENKRTERANLLKNASQSIIIIFARKLKKVGFC